MGNEPYLSQKVVMKCKWLNRCAGKNAEHMAYTNKWKFFVVAEPGNFVWPTIKAYVWHSLAQVFWLIFRKGGVYFLASYQDRSLSGWLENCLDPETESRCPNSRLGKDSSSLCLISRPGWAWTFEYCPEPFQASARGIGRGGYASLPQRKSHPRISAQLLTQVFSHSLSLSYVHHITSFTKSKPCIIPRIVICVATAGS